MTSKIRETGLREKITCYLPTDGDDKQSERATIDALRAELGRLFGGWSETRAKGGWVNATGGVEFESSIRFEVSYPILPGNYSRERAIDAFKRAGRDLAQTWLHIERTAFFAEHRKVNIEAPDSYSNI